MVFHTYVGSYYFKGNRHRGKDQTRFPHIPPHRIPRSKHDPVFKFAPVHARRCMHRTLCPRPSHASTRLSHGGGTATATATAIAPAPCRDQRHQGGGSPRPLRPTSRPWSDASFVGVCPRSIERRGCRTAARRRPMTLKAAFVDGDGAGKTIWPHGVSAAEGAVVGRHGVVIARPRGDGNDPSAPAGLTFGCSPGDCSHRASPSHHRPRRPWR